MMIVIIALHISTYLQALALWPRCRAKDHSTNLTMLKLHKRWDAERPKASRAASKLSQHRHGHWEGTCSYELLSIVWMLAPRQPDVLMVLFLVVHGVYSKVVGWSWLPPYLEADETK